MLQNLLEYLKEIFKNELPNEIVIQNKEIVDIPKKEEGPEPKIEKIINTLTYDNNPPVNEDGTIIEFDATIADKSNKQYQTHTENRKKNKN